METETETERQRQRQRQRDRGRDQVMHFWLISMDCRWVTDAGEWKKHSLGMILKDPFGRGGNSLRCFFCPCAPWTVLSVPCSALITHRCSAQVERGCQWGRSSAMSECDLIDVHVETLELFYYLYSIVTLSKGHIRFCVILVTWTNIYFYTDFSTNVCAFNWILFPVEIAF